MWAVLNQQYPNFKVQRHHQYFQGDYPVALEFYDAGACYLNHHIRSNQWPVPPLNFDAWPLGGRPTVNVEALRQIYYWLKQTQYNHRVYYNKITVFLRTHQVDDALKFLTGFQSVMTSGAIRIRAVDDSVGIGEKKASGKFKKYQYQAILRSGWYTLAETKHWMHLAETMSSDLHMTLGLKQKFRRCIKMNHSGCAVSTFYVFLQDQATLSYLWLNFPAAIKKTFKLV